MLFNSTLLSRRRKRPSPPQHGLPGRRHPKAGGRKKMAYFQGNGSLGAKKEFSYMRFAAANVPNGIAPQPFFELYLFGKIVKVFPGHLGK